MNDRPYITCRELIEFLYLYVSGELAADRVAEFERHLSVCPSCVEYIASYRQVLLLRDIEELDTEETARLLVITENAVKIRLHRARQALRELLDPALRRAVSC